MMMQVKEEISLPWWETVSTMRRFVPSLVSIISVVITMLQALTAADVGIAMGSGSDIALASAKFILLSPNLHGLLILTDLSRKVFRRIKFNFVSRSFMCCDNFSFSNAIPEYYQGWATVYNIITVPIAAGVIYPVHHARLSPVWSSLAMALS